MGVKRQRTARQEERQEKVGQIKTYLEAYLSSKDWALRARAARMVMRVAHELEMMSED